MYKSYGKGVFMKLEQLPYILEIASCQNLSGAAQKLGISQPALSKYLSNLEGELGRNYSGATGKSYILPLLVFFTLIWHGVCRKFRKKPSAP